MTTPVLTTGPPPPAGCNGIGLIFTQFTVALEPVLTMSTVRAVQINIVLTPQLTMMGPQTQTVQLSPKLIMRGGTTGTRTAQILLTPQLTMGDGTTETTSFHITLTPTLTMTGTYHASPPAGRVYGQSVQRASTF